MPDLLAGSTVNALDTPPSQSDTQNDQYNCTNTTFGIGSTAGTYIDCAVVFTAPTSGRVMVNFAGNLDNDTGAASTNIAPYVRTGAVVGSGSDVIVAALENAIRNVGTDDRRYGSSLMLEGLTPGNSYNVRLEHRVSGGTGSIQYRHLAAFPLS